ncbi:MAG: penicillin-binding transpeptidase domain-containing protein [Christensenellales bacterium]|jgi:penicillin-binding protein 2
MEKARKRLMAFSLFILMLFGILVIQLNALTVSGENGGTAVSTMTKTISQTGQRGSIYDRNGVLLAYDQKSYDLLFNRDYSKATAKDRARYTQIIRETIDIVEKNGGTMIGSFAIKRQEDLSFAFDFGNINAEAAQRREANWRSNMYIQDTDEKKMSAEEIYNYLRDLYQVPNDVDYEEAVKILSVWQEVQLNSYNASVPITIATNVGEQTVAEIEQRQGDLAGMSIQESSVRIYPKNALAAHVIGYMGQTQDEERLGELERRGYSASDRVGIAGVEYSMEYELSANTEERRGSVTNEVDTKGSIIRELERTEAENGNNILLTIDADLQKLTEEALAQNIADIREEQEAALAEDLKKFQRGEKTEYVEKVKDLDDIDLASYGAAIVMDVKTGEVLALANHSSYDLNLFTGGIRDEDYTALQEDESLPLFNKAISSKAMPGSIFKMVAGLGGLSEKVVTPEETIEDLGAYTKYTQNQAHAPACWIWKEYRVTHGDVDIVSAIKDSCNYYFFSVADELGIHTLASWGERLGLASKTNIELPSEVTGQIGGQEVLYDNTKSLDEQKTSLPKLVVRSLKVYLGEWCEERGIEADDEDLQRAAERLIELVGTKSELGHDIRVVMREELGIPETVSYYRRWYAEVSSLLFQVTWNPNQTILTGIGQSVVSVTPIAVARYISALVNGGDVLDAHVVKGVVDEDGNVVKNMEPTLVNSIETEQLYFDKIKEGMRGVASAEDGGTAADAFIGFDYLDEIGVKTGTAQISGTNQNIKLENTSWFVAFAPFDEPEIAIVVYIPHGTSGSSSAYTARQILQYYMDKKKMDGRSEQNGSMEIPDSNQILSAEEDDPQ